VIFQKDKVIILGTILAHPMTPLDKAFFILTKGDWDKK
jgi:hypothetical protein